MDIERGIFEDKRSQSILIVDDNPQNLQVLGSLLRERNYAIEFATSGKAALEWLNTQDFDLILLDINMPEMDGFEVCREIRANAKLNNMPVIFLSADSNRESILRGFEMGAQDYVTKPFDSRELIVRVRTHLELKESLEKLAKVNRYLEEKVTERKAELKMANEKLEVMNRKLTELDDAKSEFLSLISHEIRTPLNGICGPVELLKYPLQAGELNELLDILNTSVRRLENFSTNAILITTLKTKPYPVREEKVDLNRIIDELLLGFNTLIQKRGISVLRNNDDKPSLVTGDPELISKGLSNVIENALTYPPASSSVWIKTFSAGSEVCVEISDNGNGIPDKIIDSGFELFSRGNHHNDNTTGIGLPLTKMIMNAHKGRIELGNAPRGGAFVRLSFNTTFKK